MSFLTNHKRSIHSSKEFSLVIKFFELLSQQDENFIKKLISLNSTIKSGVTEAGIRGGIIPKNVFVRAMLSLSTKQGIQLTLIKNLLDKAEQFDLISAVFFPADSDVTINLKLVKAYLNLGILDNALGGDHFILEKYKNAIVEIIVTDTKGNEYSGTGFITQELVIVTNAHVLLDEQSGDHFEIKRVISDGKNISIGKTNIRSDMDLATIEVKSELDFPVFGYDVPYVLDKVLIVGYPRVPLSAKNPRLASSGQINGFFDNYLDEQQYGIIDAKVSPGNSGGPVINQLGRVCGVVCQDVEPKGEGVNQSRSCMIPATSFVGSSLFSDFTGAF